MGEEPKLFMDRDEKWGKVYGKSAAACIERRRVRPGFPITKPFESIEEVRNYLSGEKIVCLLCGRVLKKLGGPHLEKIHQTGVEEYAERYKIPWTYGIISSVSGNNYRGAMFKRMDEGYKVPMKVGAEQEKMISSQRRESPWRTEVSKSNLGDLILPKRPLEVGADGKPETFTAHRERLKTKVGTTEFHEKMSKVAEKRPQVEILRNYWKGRKQTQEHIDKRIRRKA